MKKIFLIFLCSISLLSEAVTRKALVIGNGDYSQTHISSLSNPKLDAELIAETLLDIGFEVDAEFNVSKKEFDNVINKFISKLSKNDIAFIYYAGHGVSYADQDYLLPVFPDIPDVASLKYDAINAQKIVDRISLRSKHSIFILDACRNTPFTKSAQARGIGSIQSNEGSSYVIYAARRGQQAYDNRVFAQSLAKELRKKQSLSEVSRAVRSAVMKATEGAQYPSVIDDLLEKTPIYLNGKPNSKKDTLASSSISVPSMEEIKALEKKLSSWKFNDKEISANDEIDISDKNLKCKGDIGYKKFIEFQLTEKIIKETEKIAPCLIELILETESMDDDERKYWFAILPAMTNSQIIRLFEILKTEKLKLQALEVKYTIEISFLNTKALVDFLNNPENNILSYRDIKQLLESAKSALAKGPLPYQRNAMLNVFTKLLIYLGDNAVASKEYYDVYNELYQYINYLYTGDDPEYLYDISNFMLLQAKRAFANGMISRYELQTKYLNTTWHLLFLKNKRNNFNEIIKLSKEGLMLSEKNIPLWSNYAHALALSKQEDMAKSIYIRFQGEYIDGTLWEEVILNDFSKLEKAGISSPIFNEISKTWNKREKVIRQKHTSTKSVDHLVEVSKSNTNERAMSSEECALIVASRRTLPEVREYIQENISDRRYLKVLIASNGWYAISIGTLKPNEEEPVMRKWKASGKIPQDSFCASRKKMITEVDWQ